MIESSSAHPAAPDIREPPGPVTAAQRVELADVLRGFAILGILLVNMQLFNHPIQLVVVGEGLWDRPQDRFALGLVHFFAEGKFYVLFSFLFGWGFSVLLERAEARGADAVRLYRRRIAVLAVIGALHVVLLWFGDILLVYALLGFLLPWFRRRPDRSLRRWIIGLLLAPVLLQAVLFGTVEVARATPDGFAAMAAQEAEQVDWMRAMGESALRVYSEGSFGEMVVQRLTDYGFSFFGWFLLAGGGFYVLALFLVGLYVGRKRLLHEAPDRRARWTRILAVALPVGLAANLLYLWGPGETPPETSVRGFLAAVGLLAGGPSLSAAYVAAIVLAMSRRRTGRWLVAHLAPVGRMALSNYLLQTLICTTIFYGYGLGFYGRTSPAAGLTLAVAIFAAQVVLSRIWLERYRFGPAEWAWRALTYGSPPAMRLAR
jgi:uncharacterized protein